MAMNGNNSTVGDRATASPSSQSSSAATAAALEMEQQMQNVLDMLEARTRGAVSNEQVEAAVSSMLKTQQPMASTHAHAAAAAAASSSASVAKGARPNQNSSHPSANGDGQPAAVAVSSNQSRRDDQHAVIQPDLEDYDGEESEDDTKAVATAAACSKDNEQTSSPTATNSRAKRRRTSQGDDDWNVDDKRGNGVDDLDSPNRSFLPIDWTIYEDVPLGKQGAQMMTTFGDGKHPHVTAVAAALQGARLMLQTAIQDARHVRRKQKAVYKSAKESLQGVNKSKSNNSNSNSNNNTLTADKAEWSTEILFRAAQGYDPLAYDPKCGFGIEEIQKLFPEEMNAYNRWNEMHSTATAADDEKQVVAGSTMEGEASPAVAHNQYSNNLPPSDAATTEIHGHLHERASQFDLRTTRMQGDWYLKYAQLRQGSFLPRRTKSTTGVDAEWETARKQRKGSNQQRGKDKDADGGGGGVWAHMTASTVRFLHWLGFDPTSSALAPPNEDVTCALAFLGHDFFGRIVEKAILLRQLDKKTRASNIVATAVDTMANDVDDDDTLLIELEPGEQLTEEDIAKAMQDPDIKPIPLYSSVGPQKKLGPQLYFGPGFEDRLEMELEEMMWSTRSRSSGGGACGGPSEEELQIRKQEDELFAQLAKQPPRDGVVELLKTSRRK